MRTKHMLMTLGVMLALGAPTLYSFTPGTNWTRVAGSLLP